MKNFIRTVRNKKIVLLLMAIVFIQTFAYEFYLLKEHFEAKERFLESSRRMHDNQASLAFVLEKQINSIYYQLTLDPMLMRWLVQREANLSNMYMLGDLQDKSLSIISSNPLVASVYIYSNHNKMVLASNHEFTRIEQFPEKELFTEFSEKTGHWTGKRKERAGYGSPKNIISFVGKIGSLGLVAINVDEQKLFAQFPNTHGIMLVGKNEYVLSVKDGRDTTLAKIGAESLAGAHAAEKKPARVEGYDIFVSGNPTGEWTLISAVSPIEFSSAWQSRLQTITVLSIVLCLLGIQIYRLARAIYFQPIKRLETNFNKNLDDLRHQFIFNVLNGKMKETDIYAKMQETGIRFASDRFIVIVFQIDDFFDYLLSMKKDDRFVKDKTVYNAIKWTFMTSYPAYAVKTELEKIAILLSVPEQQNESGLLLKVEETIRYLQNEIQENCNLTICAGISSVQHHLNDAHIGYYQALQSVGYKAIYGKNSIIRYEHIAACKTNEPVYPMSSTSKMGVLVKEGRIDEFEAQLGVLLNGMITEEQFSLDRMNSLFSNVLYSIVKMSLEQRFDFAEIVKEDIFLKIYSYEFVEDKKNYVIQVARTVSAYIQERKNTNNKTVQLIVEYIHANFDKPISLTTISETLGINSSYISTLMKNELGQGFVEYMHQLRIAKAEQLLTEPNLTVKQIAEICGYDTVHSFIRNFKKFHLFTPSEYRNKMLAKRNV